MLLSRCCFVALLLALPFGLLAQGTKYKTSTGSLNFTSDAPLELIEASSDNLQGVIDTEKKTFAFAIRIMTFDGFNSALQKEHFHENYMETVKFPKAVFSGKIIEEVDFSKNGTYNVRAKGKLKIHGHEQTRIIKSKLIIEDGSIRVAAQFLVPLADHDITIPKIVYKKIATEIQVTIDAVLTSS